MPWYKFYADHGPGHQSHTVHYRYSEAFLLRKEKERWWQDLFADREWPIGGVRLVRKLPKREWEHQRALYVHRRETAKRMLKVLLATQIRQTPNEEEKRLRKLKKLLVRVKKKSREKEKP